MVPPPLPKQFVENDMDVALPAVPLLRIWLRALLVLMAVLLIGVFAVAVYLNPYGEDGQARRLETHLQLGLPTCTVKQVFGIPCPSCGMTTSFALFVRGDLLNSLRANWAGTILATFCLAMIPFGLVGAVRARTAMVLSGLNWLLPRFIVLFVVLLFVRWGLVLWLG
jgi:hypothetical protein